MEKGVQGYDLILGQLKRLVPFSYFHQSEHFLEFFESIHASIPFF
jgi:hypothetical protein